MVTRSFLVCLLTSSAAFAADSNGDGCQDEFAANGACVDVDATVDVSSTVGAASSVLQSASIGPQVAIGANVVVAPRASLAGRVAHVSNPLPIGTGTVIGRGAQLGADHVLGADVTIGRSVVAGARLTVAAGGNLGYAAQIGTDVNIGADAIVGNLVDLGDHTTIGDNAVVARGVLVLDGANAGNGVSISGVIGPDVTLAAGSRVELGARIRKDADIGAGAAVEDGGRIGRGAVIGAGATVFGRVGANATVRAGATVEAGSRVARGGEVCSGATVPSGSTVLGDGTWPAEGCTVTTNCQTIKTSDPSSADGVYSIDPDGVGGAAAFDAYCDMTTDGGGWTLLMKAAGTTFGYDSAYWTNTATLNPTDLDTGHGEVAKFASFNDVSVDELMITAQSGGQTQLGLPSSQTARSLFSGSGQALSVTAGDATPMHLISNTSYTSCGAPWRVNSTVSGVGVRLGGSFINYWVCGYGADASGQDTGAHYAGFGTKDSRWLPNTNGIKSFGVRDAHDTTYTSPGQGSLSAHLWGR
jgi:acetyltransferase-like isoleucine patch superfamily enzyme